jgi:endonuclease YncB( thermonuclease family)
MPHLPLSPLWLHGRYQILGQAPDGDSLRFIPDHPEMLRGEIFSGVVLHADGGFTLRLDGVDAPETHYLGRQGLGVLAQPSPWADQAAAQLLAFLGFDSVLRAADETVLQATPQSVRGTVALMRGDRFGRGVGLAFAGNVDWGRGELSGQMVEQSANGFMACSGLAYPTFYTDTHDLVQSQMIELIQVARNKGLGLWPVDCTQQGFAWQDLSGLCQRQLILPKLFRRLVDFCGTAPGATFLQFQENLSLEVGTVVLLPQKARVEFADLLDEQAGIMSLLVPPEGILFAAD